MFWAVNAILIPSELQARGWIYAMWLHHLLLNNHRFYTWNLPICDVFSKDPWGLQWHPNILLVLSLSGCGQLLVLFLSPFHLAHIAEIQILHRTWCERAHWLCVDIADYLGLWVHHTYRCCGCLFGQIKVEVQIKVFSHNIQNSWQNESWTTVYLLTLKLKQKGLCLTQLTCCLKWLLGFCSLCMLYVSARIN